MIPTQPLSREDLLARMEQYRQGDVPWRSGRAWGYVYDAGAEISALAKDAFTMFMTENGLDPTAFASLARFENELMAICRGHLQGEDEVVGSFTSGGTESIILAVKTARDMAKAQRGVTAPEMVLPTTAHAAFHKAAHYLNVKTRNIEVDPQTFKADVPAMAQACNENTVLLVGSAASYAHGVIDPIPELGQLALERSLPLHVDGCIGAFILPFFSRLGDDLTPFDFSVPGVTSISMDLHKYAYCPKGASVVLYKSKEIRRHQFYACADWTGYSVVNATIQSSKSGGPLAAAWAVLNFVGDAGYLDIARNLRNGMNQLTAGIQKIPQLEVLGQPVMPLIAIKSSKINIFHVIDEMKARGWYVQPQFAHGSSPQNLHLTIAPSNVPHIPKLLSDLAESAEAAEKLPLSAIPEELGAMLANASPADLAGDVSGLLALVGLGTGSGLPERMAPINELLNNLPPPAREPLLCGFFNELFKAS